MPTFLKMRPSEVVLGRGRANALARRDYETAIRDAQAGRIEVDDEDPARVKRLLRQASKIVGIKVRSSWEDETRSALLWKRVGA